jgi:hypothetical protein
MVGWLLQDLRPRHVFVSETSDEFVAAMLRNRVPVGGLVTTLIPGTAIRGHGRDASEGP